MSEPLITHWLKRARMQPLANRLATASLRRLFGAHPPSVIVDHLPRIGVADALLPNGHVLKLWSEGDDFISSQIFWRGWDAHEPETSALWFSLAEKARVVLDIGAHIGTFALIAAHANPRSTVYAFEPLPAVFARLQKNRALNQLDNVVCVPMAAGAACDRALLHHTAGIPSSSSLSHDFMCKEGALQSTEVAVVPLDAFLAERGVAHVDLVKIDTESTEPLVLRGMLGTLERSRPDLIIEILPDQGTRGEIEKLLAPLGYTGRRLEPQTKHAKHIARAIAHVTDRKEPFDNFHFTTRSGI